jgi:putative transcriptional regulator
MIRVTLNELLEQRRMSQRELARRTDTHPDVISRFAREATSGVSYDLLNRICAVMSCSPGDLLQYENDQMTMF